MNVTDLSDYRPADTGHDECRWCRECAVTTIDETAHGEPFNVGDPVWFVFAPMETGVITEIRADDEFPYFVKWDDGDDVRDDDGEERGNGWYASSHLRLIETTSR